MAVSASLVKELRERTGLGMMECKKALVETDGDIDTAIENLRKASGLKAAKKADRTAAEGVVVAKIAEDGSYGVVLEINSETDFVARDEGFLAFAGSITDKAFAAKAGSLEEVIDDELESARQALVQKIGENLNIRRVEKVEAANGVVGAYVHSNNRIAVLVELSGGTVELAKDVAMHVAAVNPQVVNTSDMSEEVVNKEKDIIKAQPDMEGKPEQIVEKMMVGRINKFLKENSLVEQAFVKDPEVTVGGLVKKEGAEVIRFVRFEVGEGIEKKEEDFAAEVAAQVAASKSS
ncbi:translation elongation factor Ts [Teredinibacter franksiae]|jgi:translation elongation factor Ts (EF-Ts)|uniref:translation elongation factor Ts n=1 Tax=Teredinibacter franksiae TaxID=2761453 RepID=UPI0016240E11|nr:translation elongation factor Ts [Teredinibacter franksiae]